MVTKTNPLETSISQLNSGHIFAVIIPCYNVQNFIQDVVREIPDFIQHIFLVNDSSQDRTGEILDDIACVDPRVKVIHCASNQGVGGAVKIGFQAAVDLGATILIKLDGDGQMDPHHLLQLTSPLVCRRANFAKGNRFLHLAKLKKMPFKRRLGNTILSFMTKMASGYWNIFDPTNGFIAMDAKMFRLLNQQRIDDRYFFETSLLCELGLNRAVVKDIYIPARYGFEKSSLSELKTIFEFPPKLAFAFLRRVVFFYFLLDFNAISLFLVTGILLSSFGCLWGIYHWAQASRMNVDASTGTVMIAVLPLILGIQLLLQTVVMDIQNTPSQVIDE